MENEKNEELITIEVPITAVEHGSMTLSFPPNTALDEIEQTVLPMHVPTVEAYLTEDGKETARMALNARIEEIKELKHLLLF